jgi:uncharacterized protein YkwD
VPLLALACAAAPAAERTGQRRVAAASETAAPIATFVPGGPAATRYAATAAAAAVVPPSADPLRSAILAEARATARRLGRPAPEPDVRLDAAMTDLARAIHGDELPAADAVDFLLAHYGLIEPSPHISQGRTSGFGDAEIVSHARSELEALLREGSMRRIGVGVDRAGDSVYTVIATQERHVELLAPVPRRLPAGGRTRLAFKIDPGYLNVGFAITAPDGRVREEPPSPQATRLAGEFACGPDGRYQVEVVATNASGPTVLANFPIFCGVAAPTASPGPAGVRAGNEPPEAAERALVELVNRDRHRAGLPPLAVDPKLAAIARAHSRDMADEGFVGHVSPRTGAAPDRVRRAGLTRTLVLENVARAYGADEAEAGFLASPGHRGNILHLRARRIGVGIAYGPKTTGIAPMLVTQLFSN